MSEVSKADSFPRGSTSSRDAAHHLHSYTNARRHVQTGPLTFVKGNGIFLTDDNGNEYLEGMSGLWSAALGFSNERLANAAYKQLMTLPYCHTFNHRTTDVVAELAEKLLAMAPVPMSKVFFACSGSEANETALKMVWYVNHALGRPEKRKIISRAGAYHGVTIAATSLTGLPRNKLSFGQPLPDVRHTLCPHHYRFAADGESEEEFASRCAAELERLILDEGPKTVAAMICEPVMGAGGVIVPPKTYYAKIQAVCRKYDLLFIADEAICGFGRTGTAWGSQTLGIEPDILTCAKALSASFMPISAVMVNERVYEALAEESDKIGVWSHGFTNSGHPVAAAVALEALKIYEETGLFAHAKRTGVRFQAHLRSFDGHPLVGETMGLGMMGAIEIVADKTTRRPFDALTVRAGLRASAFAESKGLLVRAVGDRLVIAPPLIITEEQLDDLFGRVRWALDATADALSGH